MKVAHFMMVHKDPVSVKRLVDRLVVVDDHVFIHVDAKVEQNQFVKLITHPNVFFVQNRVNVNWGGYSQVQATIEGMCYILERSVKYDYINFISGQDYPVKPLAKFHQFLEQHLGSEFIEYIHEDERKEVTRKRIYKYNLTDYNFKGKYLIQKVLNLITPNRKFPIPLFKIVWKANWFILTPSCVRYVIDFLTANPKIVRFFKLGWGVDEFVFQTIIYNSPFQTKMVNRNYRYVDWSAGEASPKTLGINDLDNLLSSDDFFARKFDPNHDIEILNRLDVILDG